MASVLAIALGTAGLPRVAFAGGDDGTPDYAAAKVHYDNAEKAMAEGRYEAAAEEYGIAYEASKDPVVFIKIGNAWLAAGKCPAAVVYFKRFLKEGKPTETARESAQEKIDTCEGTTSNGTDGTVTTEPDTTEPDTTEPDTTEPDTTDTTGTETTDGEAPSFLDNKTSWKRSAGWISLGATVILGTAGAILAMSGESREEDLASLADFRDANQVPASYEGNVSDRYEKLVQEGERFNTLSRISFAAAGVTLVTAVTLLLLDSGSHHAESGSAIGLAPVVGHHGGGLAAILHF